MIATWKRLDQFDQCSGKEGRSIGWRCGFVNTASQWIFSACNRDKASCCASEMVFTQLNSGLKIGQSRIHIIEANLLQRTRTKYEVLCFDKAMHSNSSKHLETARAAFGSLEVAEKSPCACAISSCESTQLCPIALEQLPVHLFSDLQQYVTIRNKHAQTDPSKSCYKD